MTLGDERSALVKESEKLIKHLKEVNNPDDPE
jgi:hypothetical protein